ncbi:MAG: PEGA domain-containing protein, partial [Spirochaetales bacterium]
MCLEPVDTRIQVYDLKWAIIYTERKEDGPPLGSGRPRHAGRSESAMEKRLVPLLLFLALALQAASAQEGAASSPSIPSMNVSFLGFDSNDIGISGLEILGEMVRKEISLAPGFSLVERAGLGSVISEQELRLSDAFEGTGAIQVGQLLGADHVMVGRIGILGTLYIISLRLISVETGQVVRAVTEEYLGPIEDLRKPVRVATQRILGIPGIEIKMGEYISVETEPPGVAVYVNGLFEGNGPVVIRVPKPGKYAIKLSSAG